MNLWLDEIRSLWYWNVSMLCVSKAEHNGARYDTHFYLSSEGSRRNTGKGLRFSLQTFLWNGQSRCWHRGPQYLKMKYLLLCNNFGSCLRFTWQSDTVHKWKILLNPFPSWHKEHIFERKQFWTMKAEIIGVNPHLHS